MSLEQSKTKSELEALCVEYDVEIPTNVRRTKKVMAAALEALGVTDDGLRALKKKEKMESIRPEVNIEGMTVICMDRPNLSFGFKHYKFYQNRKYVVMQEEDAKELLATTPGFRRASRDEVLRYYKL